jgi:tetratricopeptide (TPR) repeat protein
VLRRKAGVLRLIGKWEEAERIYRGLLEGTAGDRDRSEEAETLHDLCEIIHYRGQYRECLSLAERSMEISIQTGDVGGQVRALGMLGNVYSAWSDYRRALEYLEKMEKLAEGSGLELLAADARRKMGIAHFWLGDTGQALECLEKSRRLADKFNNPQFMGGILHAIGLVHRERRDFPGARPFLEESLRIFRLTGDLRSIGMALGNLAGLHYYLEEYGQALELYQRQVEIARKLGDKYFLACAYGDISAIFMELGRLEEAREMAAGELALARETEDKLSIGDSHYRLGLIAEFGADDAKAEMHFNAAVDYGRQVQSGRFLPDYLMAKANLLYRKGDKTGAREIMEEARLLAGEFKRQDVLDKCRALELLMVYPEQPELSEKGLLEMAEGQPEDSDFKAGILHKLWKCSGKENQRLQALEIYRRLAEKKAYFGYRRIIEELEAP